MDRSFYRCGKNGRRNFIGTISKAALWPCAGAALMGCATRSQHPRVEGSSYYMQKKRQLMFMMNMVRPLMKRSIRGNFGDAEAKIWYDETRQGFENLLPRIPYIGGDENPMTQYLVMSSMFLPLFKAMTRDGASPSQCGRVFYEVAESYSKLKPARLRWRNGRKTFTPAAMEQVRKDAEHSQLRKYPGDWVYRFVKGGSDFQYGMDMIECGIVKFWDAEGMAALTRYNCLSDWVMWKSQRIVARRTRTIANGASVCNFRFIGVGVDCQSGWPPQYLKEWTGDAV